MYLLYYIYYIIYIIYCIFYNTCVCTGAPQILIQLIKSNKSYDETSKKVTEQVEKDMTSYGLRGIRCLAVARTVITSPKNEPEWQFLG